ncbi:MAG: LEA type 2 family protein [Gemmatimonadota bacterium]|nr:LEA type 2 family protein [Gemmatimonadota bacterium]
MRGRTRRWTTTVTILAALALAGCATLETLGVTPLRFEEAEDRSTRLRIVGPTAGDPLGGASIRIWAEVENPNGFGLTLTRLAGDLFVEDSESIAVDFPLGLPLAARQDTVIPLDVSIGFDDLPSLGRAARAAIAGESLTYRLDGSFTVDAGAWGQPRFGPLTLLSGEMRVR